MFGVAIEIALPSASTVPPGSVVTVWKSAVATQLFVNVLHCRRIV